MGKLSSQLSGTKNVDNTDIFNSVSYFIILIYKHTKAWTCVRECRCATVLNNQTAKKRTQYDLLSPSFSSYSYSFVYRIDIETARRW